MSSTDLVVGCPSYRREWILPQWHECVCEAIQMAGIPEGRVKWVFVGPVFDPSWEVLFQRIEPSRLVLKFTQEDLDRPDERNWDASRIQHMVGLRNQLLKYVRALEPTYFLSLDSDILIDERALRSALSAIADFDAVGMKCYLGAGLASPSYANLVNDWGMSRPDSDQLFAVDVIMGAKLMTPAAYEVDYRFHAQGEDVGWGIACREKGIRLAWDGRHTSWHVRSPKELGRG